MRFEWLCQLGYLKSVLSRWAHGKCGWNRNACVSVSVGKPEGKRPRHRWEDKFNLNYIEIIGIASTDLCASEQGQVAGCCEYGNEYFGFHKMLGIS